MTRRRRSHHWKVWLLITLAVTTIGGLYLARQHVNRWSETPRLIEPPIIIELKPRMGLRRLAVELETLGIASPWWAFTYLVREQGGYEHFQAGTYQFAGDVAPVDVMQKMLKGMVYEPVVLSITIPEGFTLKKINERLAAAGVGKETELRAISHDAHFLRDLKVPGHSLEGYIYPATYTFAAVPTPDEFYRKAVGTFWQRLPPNYQKDITQMGLTLQEAVTFASLIELETYHEEEKPLVAEVIWRRFKNKVPLGIDAALIYGIPDYKGDIRWKDLKNAQNPYNTRVHPGLPPSPIGSVSDTSLEAVLRPADFGYYYYVLRADDLTRHQFSRTLDEHNKLVRALVAAGHAGKTTIRHPPKERSHGTQESEIR